MDNQQDYYNFLKIFFNEEIYLIDEEDVEIQTSAEDEVSSNIVNEPEVIPVQSPEITGNHNSEFAFIIDETFSETLQGRFETMISRLGLSADSIALIRFKEGKSPDNLTEYIKSLDASYVVILGMKDQMNGCISAGEMKIVDLDQKHLLFAPSFQSITQNPDLVKSFWKELSSLIPNRNNG